MIKPYPPHLYRIPERKARCLFCDAGLTPKPIGIPIKCKYEGIEKEVWWYIPKVQYEKVVKLMGRHPNHTDIFIIKKGDSPSTLGNEQEKCELPSMQASEEDPKRS